MSYVNSFFPCRARLWNFIPLTYDLNGFKSRINSHILTVGSFLTDFILFLVAPCLVVAVQPCMEWIRIKKKCILHHGWLKFWDLQWSDFWKMHLRKVPSLFGMLWSLVPLCRTTPQEFAQRSLSLPVCSPILAGRH